MHSEHCLVSCALKGKLCIAASSCSHSSSGSNAMWHGSLLGGSFVVRSLKHRYSSVSRPDVSIRPCSLATHISGKGKSIPVLSPDSTL